MRYGPVVAWLTAPWRGAAFAFGGLLRLIVRNLPTAKAALVLVPVLPVMAGVQAVQQHAWAPLAVLVLMAVVLTVHPVADAALSRASEPAVDKYAASVGSSSDLISALGVLPRSRSYDTGQLHGTTPTLKSTLAACNCVTVVNHVAMFVALAITAPEDVLIHLSKRSHFARCAVTRLIAQRAVAARRGSPLARRHRPRRASRVGAGARCPQSRSPTAAAGSLVCPSRIGMDCFTTPCPDVEN
jgi:hypothetical protein